MCVYQLTEWLLQCLICVEFISCVHVGSPFVKVLHDLYYVIERVAI
jgi:hypothetical protein